METLRSMKAFECDDLNVDLHCHSTISDGLLSPAAVVARAVHNGVELLALTDHDELGGVAEAAQAARAHGVRFIPGVEISTSFLQENIHIVGLAVNPENATLQQGLADIRCRRRQRTEKMAQALELQLGVKDALQGASAFAANPALVNRAHFARFLVKIGLAPNVSEVFRYYLRPGKPGYVEQQWCEVAEAVEWIRAADGVAVLAHPGRYRLEVGQMASLYTAFCAAGGEAIEVVSGSHRSDKVKYFAAVARQYGFLASRGSDFHGEQESPVDVGCCVSLPQDLTPVWRSFL